jgi:D-alanyl-D-alanine carboxypeptidase/D-alanyl-D-alanine-endopeptidase (penicillin-binding protein 4)
MNIDCSDHPVGWIPWLWNTFWASSILFCCVQTAAASATASSGENWQGLLKSLQSHAGLVGIQVVSLPDRRVVFEHESHVPLTPASLLKILTSYAALKQLGPYYHFQTEVWSLQAPQNGTVHGNLWIKGGGDPYIVPEKAYLLAQRIKEQGVRVIEGGIFIDNSYFRPQTEKICLDGQCDRPYNPVLAATSLDFNTLTMRLLPGPKAGSPILIEVYPPGDYALLVNQASTGGARNAEGGVTLQSAGPTTDGREKYLVTGNLPTQSTGGSESRLNVSDPVAFFARSLKTILGQVGVEVRGNSPGSGTTPSGAQKLAQYDSPPLGDMLHGLNRYSNNFMAEMLLRSLGAEVRGAPGTEEKGLSVVRATLAEVGIAARELELESGSGLSRRCKLSPHALCTVLAAAYRDFTLAPEFIASLATSGEEGTLRRRLHGLQGQSSIRGKTGSLRDVVGFAGYVSGPAPGPYAVVILLNDVRQLREAKTAIDGFLARLAGSTRSEK